MTTNKLLVIAAFIGLIAIGAAAGFFAGQSLSGSGGDGPAPLAEGNSPDTGGGLASQQGAQSTATPQSLTLGEVYDRLNITDRPFKGPADAPVTLVEFTDYECPFCHRHFTNTQPQILQHYGDRVKYVVVNLPLVDIHPHAAKAAEAAECALDQGRFWEYHDRLFNNQDALTVPELKGHAEALGLDTGQFNECLDSGAKREIVREHVETADALGFTGTPSFLINNTKLVGARQFAIFSNALDSHLPE